MTVSMSAVWDRTAEFLSERMAPIAAIALPALLIPAAIGETLAPLGVDPSLRGAFWLLAIVLGIVSLWGQLALTSLTLDSEGRAAGAWARATRRLPAMVLVGAALLLAALLLALPVLAILIAHGIDPTRLNQPGAIQALSAGGAGLIGAYMLIATPLVLWLMARVLVLVPPVVVAEGLALGALGRAFRLTRGLALRIIGVLLLYAIVSWVATLAARTVVGSILQLLLGGEGKITVASAATALCVAAVATIFSVIGTVFPAKLYLAAEARDAVPPA